MWSEINIFIIYTNINFSKTSEDIPGIFLPRKCKLFSSELFQLSVLFSDSSCFVNVLSYFACIIELIVIKISRITISIRSKV